jgi:hypothetical protein
MDAHKNKIAMEWAKHLKRENVDLDAILHSLAENLRESTKTIERLQLIIQEFSCHVPIIHEQLEVHELSCHVPITQEQLEVQELSCHVPIT